jgi:hypothetical protein
MMAFLILLDLALITPASSIRSRRNDAGNANSDEANNRFARLDNMPGIAPLEGTQTKIHTACRA